MDYIVLFGIVVCGILALFYSLFLSKKAGSFPVITVETISKNYIQNSTFLRFDVEETTVIGLVSLSTAYSLETLAENILTKLFTNENFVKEFNDLKVKVDYRYDDSGEQVLAEAQIALSCSYQEEFKIEPEDNLDKIHIGVDCIEPFDPNLDTSGPDGRNEAEFDITL